MSLPDALERAASALPADADAIRPANGDPVQLLATLDAEAATRLLDWLLRNETEDADELAAAWSEQEAGAEPLIALDPADLPKPGRKVLKRALHRLRSRGVSVEPKQAASPVVARLPKLEETVDQAFISGLDPRGGRMLLLVESNPAGGFRLFQLVVDELRGIVECEVFSAGRSRIRHFLDDLKRRVSTREVESACVRALVARAAGQHPTDRPLPRSFSEWRTHLTRDSAGPTPGDVAREALGGAADPSERALIRKAEDLVKTNALGPWPPDTSELVTIAERLKEQAEGRIIVSGGARREQVETLLGDAATEIFDEAVRKAMARRFEECAFMLWKGEREEEARACLAVATVFRDSAPDENEIARALIEIWLAPLLRELRESDPPRPNPDEEPPLLVES